MQLPVTREMWQAHAERACGKIVLSPHQAQARDQDQTQDGMEAVCDQCHEGRAVAWRTVVGLVGAERFGTNASNGFRYIPLNPSFVVVVLSSRVVSMRESIFIPVRVRCR